MSERLKISVVMPSFNHAEYIRQAIDSVLSQDYGNVELLVMDGGSTDGTVEILRSYGDRIRFVSERDRGQSDALNRGLAQVDGEVQCWLNSDDYFIDGALSAVAAAFRQHPGVDFVYGNGWNVSERGETLGSSGVLPFDCWKLIHQRNFIQQASCFFRGSLFESVGPIDEALHYVMDWDLWIRFAAHRGHYIRDWLSANRLYDENKTQSGRFERWREIRRMVGRYTKARWPPVLTLYLLEAIVQSLRVRRATRLPAAVIGGLFMLGMHREMGGRFSDGGVSREFRCSIGNPGGRDSAVLHFTPLSHYDSRRRGLAPLQFTWEASTGRSGTFRVLENGQRQEIRLPVAGEGFTHFRFSCDSPGIALEAGEEAPRRRIVGFLDEALAEV